MIRLQQYLPAFVEAGTAQIVDCLTYEDLLGVPWVEAFMHPVDGHPFFRFSRARQDLVAEYAGGSVYYIVGRIHKGELPIPIWEPKEREEKMTGTGCERDNHLWSGPWMGDDFNPADDQRCECGAKTWRERTGKR